MKHTPGPWRVEDVRWIRDGVILEELPDDDRGGTYALNIGTDDDYIAVVQSENADADARLIATAPELLDALRDLALRADNTEVAGAGYSLDTAWAHALLARIEGSEAS